MLQDYSVKFLCPECGNMVHEFVDMPAYDTSSDRARDHRAVAEEQVICSSCDESYELQLANAAHGATASLLEHSEIPVSVVEPDDYVDFEYQEYLDSLEPVEPYEIFKRAWMEINALGREPAVSDLAPQLMHRMLFLQHVTIMESYLNDFLIKVIADHPEALLGIIRKHDKFSAEKISWVDALTNTNKIHRAVRGALDRQLYHRLGQVDFLFQSSVGFSIFASEASGKRLKELMLVRHHFAHRNGFDTDRNKVTLTGHEVDEISKLVDEMTFHIERRYMIYTGSLFAGTALIPF